MNYTIEESQGPIRVKMNGRLTFAEGRAADDLTRRIERLGKRDCELDLGGLEFLDSTGLGMLIVLYDTVHAQGGTLRLSGAQGTVRRQLDKMDFDRIVEMA